jgi:hypothetical protein
MREAGIVARDKAGGQPPRLQPGGGGAGNPAAGGRFVAAVEAICESKRGPPAKNPVPP